MAKYNTNQRKILLDYLAAHHDCALSVQRIAEDLEDCDISLSAVYRNLAALEAEGAVRRCAKSGDRTAYYQFVGRAECKNRIHLSCIKCGKTCHLSAPEEETVVEAVAEAEGFVVDKSETVLYGLCGDCALSER